MSSSRYAARPPRDTESALRDVQQHADGNLHCADCSHPRPDFINYTIGTFVCEKCADIHRSTSNRRIKDMYGGDITVEDVRRMENVGNDVANRKFLANWDPNEFPEPDRNDREALLQFIWLKYEGTFKKPEQNRPNPAVARPSSETSRDYGRGSDNRYHDVGHDSERNRNRPNRRENELFQDGSNHPDRPRSYWGSRFAPPPPTRQPSRPIGPPPPSRHDDYHLQQSSAQYADRYQNPVPSNRFHPPPAPVAPYTHTRGGPHRYNGNYEDYGPPAGYDRDTRRGPVQRAGRFGREEVYINDYDDVDNRLDAPSRRKSKTENRVRRKNSVTDDDSYSSTDKNSNLRSSTSRKDKKVSTKKSKKPTKEKKGRKQGEKGRERRRRDEEEDDDQYDVDDESDSDNDVSDNEDEEPVDKRKKSKRKTSSTHDKRSDRDAESIRTASADGIDDVSNKAQPGDDHKDFDLMSEWMGDSKDTDTSQGVGLPPGIPSSEGVSNNAMPLPFHPQQAYQTQMPLMPPMGLYNSVMPGFMPMMHPNMQPAFIQGMGPMPPPGLHPGMVPMPGMQPPSVLHPGMQGLMNGMQNLGLNATAPQGSSQSLPNISNGVPTLPGMSTAPPPPPPMGMPAGPPPGPPPEPPQ